MVDLEKQIEVDAEIYAYDISVDFASVARINSFIQGAKSEAAKAYHTKGMYSEEEVLELLLNYAGENPIHLKEWFDKSKKK